MASFSVFVPGTAEDATELRGRLNEVGTAIGYGPRRGGSNSQVARGAAGLMLRDIGEGKAAVLPQGEDGDLDWLSGVFAKLLAEHPERREVLVSGIEACGVAAKMRERGVVGGRDLGGRFDLTDEE